MKTPSQRIVVTPAMFAAHVEGDKTLYTLSVTLPNDLRDLDALIYSVQSVARRMGCAPYVYVGVTPETHVVDFIASKQNVVKRA